jgi:hypothetical protein
MSKVQATTNTPPRNGCQKQVQYESEVRTAMLGGREIRVENLTPVLSPKEREERKREIEKLLFNVFVKYTGKADNRE